MPESELAQQVTQVIKRADKLIRDIKKDTADLFEVARKLKEVLGGKEGKDEDEKGI